MFQGSCVLGVQIRDVTERIINPADYYPLLEFHVGVSDIESSSLGTAHIMGNKKEELETSTHLCGYGIIGMRDVMGWLL